MVVRRGLEVLGGGEGGVRKGRIELEGRGKGSVRGLIVLLGSWGLLRLSSAEDGELSLSSGAAIGESRVLETGFPSGGREHLDSPYSGRGNRDEGDGYPGVILEGAGGGGIAGAQSGGEQSVWRGSGGHCGNVWRCVSR